MANTRMICALCAGSHLESSCALGRSIIDTAPWGPVTAPPAARANGTGVRLFWNGERYASVRSAYDRRPALALAPPSTEPVPSGRRAVPRRARLTVVGF